jgi:5-methylcytosine-specific restriction protein B
LESGDFKKFCEEAAKENNKDKFFIFIIDEINRSNLSAVFGELLYCLEYRGEEISIPLFKEKFSIPENVYVIGTMNDVDKSLQIFDRALRRRFYFYHHKPNMNVLRTVLHDKFEEKSLENYIGKAITLNNSITKELQLEANYQIGHAYFLKIKDFFPDNSGNAKITAVELEKLWEYSLRPLLEAYLGNRLKSSEDQLNEIRKIFCSVE